MDLTKKSGVKGAAFFKQTKDSSELLAAQEKQRLSLLKGLSRSIKEVQVMFANLTVESPSKTYIGDCRAAHRLCAQFEDILRQGLKPGWFGTVSTFWPVVLKISRKQAIQYIKGLQYAQTDNGRCRAWIRLAVNECSLESYINVLCQDSKLLSYYYESHSFLRNDEMVTALTQMLVGLTELTFKLTVDTASLEFEAAPEAINNAPLKLKTLESTSNKGKGTRRPKKERPHVEENGFVSDNTSVSGESSEAGGSSEGGWSGNSSPAHNKRTQDSEKPSQLDSEPSRRQEPDVSEGGLGSPQTSNPEVADETLHSPSESWSGQDSGDGTSAPDQSVEPSLGDEPVELAGEVAMSSQVGPVTTGHASPAPVLGTEQWLEANVDTVEPKPLSSELELPEEPKPLSSELELPEESKPLSSELESSEGSISVLGYSEQPASLGEPVMEEILTKERVESPSDTLSDSPPPSNVVKKKEGRDDILESEHTSPNIDSEHGNGTQDIISQSLMFDTNISTTVATGRKNTNPFVTEDQQQVHPEPPGGVVSVSPKWEQTIDTGELYLGDDKRESVLSRDTLVADPLESSSDMGVRGSRDSTPKRKGTNPFLDSDEDDLDCRLSQATNPFADDDSLPSSQVAQTRPVSFSIPPPPQRLPSNPFIDDITPIVEDQPGMAGSHGNRPHPIQAQSSVDSVDTPTIEKCLPSLDHVNLSVSSKNLPDGFDQLSNETTPSISPVSFLKDQSPDTLSTGSSQDLSVILEGAWEPGSPTHLSPTENHFGAELSVAELTNEISRLKGELRGSVGEEVGKSGLRRQIVLLQLRLQQLKDTEEDDLGDSSYQEVFGHRFTRQPRQTKLSVTPPTCEGCRKHVRGLIRPWYLCKVCSCASHKGCLPKVTRRCNPLIKTKEDTAYKLAVCPERGLTQQKFRCGSCTQAFNGPSAGARLCDYTGLYHCKSCHHGEEAVIPARVVHNWDFKPRKVCYRCSDLLTQLSTKALIPVREVNPHLYTYVPDLSTVEALRQDLLTMKKYFVQCRLAREAQLLQRVNQLLHFKNSARKYSLSDLIRVQDGSLLPRLQEARRDFVSHIKEECPLCSGKGYVCELCKSEEVLFPFDQLTSQCGKCMSVFHKGCFSEMTNCPRCARYEERNKWL